jgi:hypothetical protein
MIVIAVILIVLFLGVFSALYRVTGNDWMDDLWDFLRERWWGLLICALFFWAIAALYYSDISRHGYVPQHPLALIVYGMFGKWGWVYVWGFFGALFTFVGIWNLVVRILYGKSDDE